MSRITAYDGQLVDAFDPSPSNFTLENVAHALANKCRFNGHTVQFYSVAQHSVLVASLVAKEFQFDALFHDVDEVFLPDIPTPIKNRLTTWKEYEIKQRKAAAGFYPILEEVPVEVKRADKIALILETDALMMSNSVTPPEEVYRVLQRYLPYQPIISPLDPVRAKKFFINAYEELIKCRAKYH